VEVGQTIQLSATARDASGNPLEGVQFTWLSSNEAVASVAGGVVTARGVGTATITSSAGGQEGRVDITVEPAVAAIVFEPREITSASGKSVQIAQPTPDHAATASAPLLVVMRDAAGNVIPRHSIRFGSSNPAVARVNETGTIELLAPGSARIVATAGQVSGELVVEVIRPYTLVALGTLGGAESRAYGINENGQIVGEACAAQQCRVPFLWENGAMTALEGGRGVAYGINDAGIIVGTNGANQGVMWQGGKLSALYGSPNTEGFTYARAYGINRAGEIVGARTGGFCTRNCPWNGFQWRGGQISEFEVFAHAINNNGQIVGFRYINMSTPQAVILENGQIRELAPLGSAAYDINDRGEAVGFSNEQGSNAFRWHNGLDTRLGVLRGRNLGRAYSINNQGHIVGASGGVGGDFSMSSPRAFLWRDGRMTDLNNLFTDATWVLEEARAINDRGQIVGVGRNRTSGAAGALLLNPPQ
jgi:probable HAF family extracellular repeat protein